MLGRTRGLSRIPAVDTLASLQERATALCERARPVRTLPAEIVLRTRIRVLTQVRPSSVPRRRAFAIATLGCVLGAFGGAALAAHYLDVLPAKVAAPAPRPRVHPRPNVRPAAAPDPQPLAEPAVPQPVATRPAPRRARVAVAKPEDTQLARESATLGAALRALEVDDDARAALGHLDTYETRFPSGQLRAEAKLARAQALVRAGRSRDALAFLEGLSLDGASRGGELLVLRGELRAARGRCDDARSDFDRSLAREPDGPRAERALFGRASCRGRAGDVAGARADLETYLQRFPRGRFRAEARRALESGR